MLWKAGAAICVCVRKFAEKFHPSRARRSDTFRMGKGAGRASGVTQHVGASGAKRDMHLERERVQRDRFRELYNQGERRGAVLAAWDGEPVDDPRYDTSWVEWLDTGVSPELARS